MAALHSLVRRLTSIGCLLVLCAAVNGQDPPAKLKGLPTGKWVYESQITGGYPLPKGALEQIWVEITETSFIRCSVGGVRLESKLVADPTKKPMEFTLEWRNAVTGKSGIVKGIYKIEGERLILCDDNSGKTRPKEFKSPKGESSIGLSVLMRKMQ